MKTKILLIAGCSHAAGSEIDGTTDSLYNRQHSFGALLANKMDRTPINIALHGATNSGISRMVLNWFNTEYDPTTMDVFVMVAWTESTRLEVASKTRPFDYRSVGGSPNADWFDFTANQYYRINFGWPGGDEYERTIIPIYQKFMAENETMLETWAANYVLQIQYFLRSLRIDYVMCDTMHMFNPDDMFVKHYIDLIDSSKYYNLNKGTDSSFYWIYTNKGYKNDKAEYWHHSEEPHELYANELYNFIGESNV